MPDMIGKLRRLEGWDDLRNKAEINFTRFKRRYLTYRGRFHYLQYRRRLLAVRRGVPLAYPNVVHLELTSRCNARCVMCPHHSLTRPKTDMPYEVACSVIRDWPAGGIDRAALFFFGESLLYRRLPEVVALIKERQPRAMIYVTSNGQLLTPELSSELWKVGLNALAVSYQGDEAALHEQLMLGITNDTVERNILAAEESRRRLNPRAIFKINSLLMPQTNARVEEMRRLWTGRGIPLELSPEHEEYRLLVPGLPVPSIRHRPCSYLYYSATVYAHGEVGFCCGDPDASLSLGNVTQEALGKIWMGATARELRRRHSAGDFSQEPICDSCAINRFHGPVF